MRSLTHSLGLSTCRQLDPKYTNWVIQSKVKKINYDIRILFVKGLSARVVKNACIYLWVLCFVSLGRSRIIPHGTSSSEALNSCPTWTFMFHPYMTTSSNGNIFRVIGPLKGQWRGALMFSLICTWIYSWVNNPEAGDLRRHRAIVTSV